MISINELQVVIDRNIDAVKQHLSKTQSDLDSLDQLMDSCNILYGSGRNHSIMDDWLQKFYFQIKLQGRLELLTEIKEMIKNENTN